MWESPINVMEIQEPIIEQLNKEREEMVLKQIWKIGVDVDKEELIKALAYDRNQYEKGYKDGYAKAIDEYMNALCDKCLDMKNECYQLECPFCGDGCDIVNIAEKLKGGAIDG